MRSKVSLILVRKNFSSFNFHSIEFFFLYRVDTSYMIHPCVYAATTSCKNLGRIFTSNKSIWSAMFSWRSHFGHFSFLANIFLWNFRQALYIFTMASYLERWFHGRYEIRSLRLHIPKGARFCLLEMHNQISAAWSLWTESRDRMLLACRHRSCLLLY